MNANRYRLIFDKRTGMLVPVAEFTNSAKKGNARGIGDGMGDTSTPKWSTLCIAMAIAAGGGAPRAVHAQMIPDGTTQTTVTQTSNGVPLVNIANPNASGLSHNKFTDFNVDTRGAVFNNSQVDANTRIGGQALKNPHLARNASGILAEITGNNTSRLLGTMEVHGAPADLIIANPNGIFANGVSILGANNLTLTTGKPDALGRKFEVHGGHVEIGAAGLSTEGLNYFDVVARSIALHGEVSGGNAHARLAAGLNTLDRGAPDRPVTKREDGGGAGAPALAIQGSAVGAMHGTHVTLLSTESGVGVRHEGRILSSTDIEISVDGDLRVRRMEAQQNAFLKGHDVSLGGTGDTMETPSGKINHWLRVNALGDLHMQGIYNLEKAELTAAGTLVSEGAHVNALRRETNTQGRIDVTAGAIDILGGQWSASNQLHVNADSMKVSADAQVVTRDGYITVAGTLENKGAISADNGGTYTFDVGNFKNLAGAQVQAAYVWMTAGLLDNFGSVVGRKELDIELGAGESRNTGTLRSTEGNVEISGVSAILRNNGQITAEEGAAYLQLAALYNLNTLKTKHYIEATIAQGLENTGTIATHDIDIVAGLDVNQSVGEHAAYAKELEVVVPDGIAREMIVGAYKVNVDGVVPDSFMPNPHFEAEFDRAKLAELSNDLAHLHRDTRRTRDDMLANGNTNGARMADETLGRVEDYFLEVMEHQKKGARLEADRRGFRTTELYKDPYKNLVVIATDMEDPNVTRAASRLRLKHFGNSAVVAPEGGTLRTLMGDADDLQDGPMKIQVVGDHRADGTIGGRTPEEIAQYVADAKRQFGGEVAKVTLVSCDTAACGKTQLRAALDDMRTRMGGKSALVDALESMSQDIGGHDTVDDVVKALRTHGIDANVVGREGAVIVERDGSKQTVPHGTAGTLGVPESSREFTEATLKE